MNLQARFDLKIEKDRLGDRLLKKIHARVAGYTCLYNPG